MTRMMEAYGRVLVMAILIRDTYESLLAKLFGVVTKLVLDYVAELVSVTMTKVEPRFAGFLVNRKVALEDIVLDSFVELSALDNLLFGCSHLLRRGLAAGLGMASHDCCCHLRGDDEKCSGAMSLFMTLRWTGYPNMGRWLGWLVHQRDRSRTATRLAVL